MDKKHLKQRVVGAIVLVALGVIFIPIILNRDDSGISGSNIPDVPSELEKLAERKVPKLAPAPKKPETVRQIIDKKSARLEAEKKAAVAKKSAKVQDNVAEIATQPVQNKVQKKTQGKARAWVVQVASFAERKKALVLRDKLRKAKFTTFVESVSTRKNVLFRVRVGPVVRKSEAEQMKKKIAKNFKLKDALVMVHP